MTALVSLNWSAVEGLESLR